MLGLVLAIVLGVVPAPADEYRMLASLIDRYGYEVVAVEMVRLQAEGRYSPDRLRVAVECRFPVL